jgi:hypothetical protein
MRRYPLGSVALALVLASCSASDGAPEADVVDPFAQATPDVAGLTFETTFASGAGVGPCIELDGRCELRVAAGELDASLRAVLEQVEAAAAAPWQQRSGSVGAETLGAFVQYGPVHVPPEDPVVTFHLWVESLGAGSFRWRLDAFAHGTTWPTATVAAGRVTPGDRPHRGTGVLGVDLDALTGLGPEVAARFLGAGRILVSYVNDGDEKAALYRLDGFDPDAFDTVQSFPDAVMFAFRRADGRAGLRMSIDAGILPGARHVAERVLGRVSWMPGAGAATASIVTGLDAASFGGDHLVLLSCSDAAGLDTYRRLFACTSATTAGEPSCVLATGVPRGFAIGTPELCPAGVPRYSQTEPPPRSAADSCESEPMAGTVPVQPPASMEDLIF